jgi:hypothetical protein
MFVLTVDFCNRVLLERELRAKTIGIFTFKKGQVIELLLWDISIFILMDTKRDFFRFYEDKELKRLTPIDCYFQEVFDKNAPIEENFKIVVNSLNKLQLWGELYDQMYWAGELKKDPKKYLILR